MSLSFNELLSQFLAFSCVIPLVIIKPDTPINVYTLLPKYNKIQVLPGITSCRLMKYNKQAIELNDLLKK